MSSTPERIIEYLQTIETTYKDCRVVTQLEMRCLVWYFLYVQNVLSQFSTEWTGCVFRQSEESCLFVTKAVREGTPQVVYVTARTPIDCVRVFVRKWHNDTLEWYPDRYA